MKSNQHPQVLVLQLSTFKPRDGFFEHKVVSKLGISHPYPLRNGEDVKLEWKWKGDGNELSGSAMIRTWVEMSQTGIGDGDLNPKNPCMLREVTTSFLPYMGFKESASETIDRFFIFCSFFVDFSRA